MRTSSAKIAARYTQLHRLPSSTCRAHYPGGSVRFFGYVHDALPHRAYPEPLWPSLNERQVGIHNFPFEACSSFTRVTACRLAHPPYVGFVTRLPSRRLTRRNGPSAIQSYRQLLEWDFHPLVICAFEAHVRFAKRGLRLRRGFSRMIFAGKSKRIGRVVVHCQKFPCSDFRVAGAMGRISRPGV